MQQVAPLLPGLWSLLRRYPTQPHEPHVPAVAPVFGSTDVSALAEVGHVTVPLAAVVNEVRFCSSTSTLVPPRQALLPARQLAVAFDREKDETSTAEVPPQDRSSPGRSARAGELGALHCGVQRGVGRPANSPLRPYR